MFQPNTGTIYEWHLRAPRKDKSKPYSWDYLNLYGDNKRIDISMDWTSKTLIFNYRYTNPGNTNILLLDNNTNYLRICDAFTKEHNHILFTLDDTDYTGEGIIAHLDSDYYINFISYNDIQQIKCSDTYLDGILVDNKLLFIKNTSGHSPMGILIFATQDVLISKTVDMPKMNNMRLGVFPERGMDFVNCKTLYAFPNQIETHLLRAFPNLKTIIIKGNHTEQDEKMIDYAKEHNINIYELTHIFENGDIIEKHGFGYEYSDNLIFK